MLIPPTVLHNLAISSKEESPPSIDEETHSEDGSKGRTVFRVPPSYMRDHTPEPTGLDAYSDHSGDRNPKVCIAPKGSTAPLEQLPHGTEHQHPTVRKLTFAEDPQPFARHRPSSLRPGKTSLRAHGAMLGRQWEKVAHGPGLGLEHPSYNPAPTTGTSTGVSEQEEPIDQPSYVYKATTQSNSSLLARLYVHGMLTTVVVDTGASHSCVSYKAFLRLPQVTQNRLKPAPEFASVDASGQKMHCMGSVTLLIQAPNQAEWRKAHKWFVMRDLPCEAIMGLDMLILGDSTINLKAGMLTMTGRHSDELAHVPVWWHGTPAEAEMVPNVLVTSADVHMAPGHSNFAVCQVVLGKSQLPMHLAQTTGVVEALINQPLADYHTACSIAHLSRKSTHPDLDWDPNMDKVPGEERDLQCSAWLTNTSDHHVFVPSGTPIGRFVPLQQNHTGTLLATPNPLDGEVHPSPSPGPTVHPSRRAQLNWEVQEVLPQRRAHKRPFKTEQARQAHEEQCIPTAPTDIAPPSTSLPPGIEDPDHFTYPGVPEADRPAFSRKVRRLLSKYTKVFSQFEGDYGLCKVDELTLELSSNIPVYKRPYNIPHHLRDPLQKQLDMLYKAEVIENARSPYSAPLVLVAKKDGGVRVCVDFRFLNAITKKDGYPIPRIDTSLDLLRGAKVFSVFDLYGGFHQFSVRPQDREKLAFTTPWGQFQYKRAPMGVANMPSLFSRAMNNVFADMLFVHLLVYIDDLLLYSENCEAHLVHMEALLQRLQESGLKLSGKKSQLFTDKVNYLGHLVHQEGISPDSTKISAIKDKSYPTNIGELRSDLGLFAYYREFVPYFSHTAEPLYRLLGSSQTDKALLKALREAQKATLSGPTDPNLPKSRTKGQKAISKARDKGLNAAFTWGPEQAQAYDALRQALVEAPTLVHPDFSKPFIVDSDASQVALGGVCSQLDEHGREHPVAYASRNLSPSERNYATTKREGLGVYWAVCRAFKQYTYGAPFILRTDHSSLTSIYAVNDLSVEIVAATQGDKPNTTHLY